MAPSMSLCRTSRPVQSGLAGNAHRSSQQQRQPRTSVAAHATTPDDRCNAAIASLSAGALLMQSALVDPAAAAQLASPPASPAVVSSAQLTSSPREMMATTSAPAVRDNVTRTASGPEANLNDPDAYFDALDRMTGKQTPPVPPGVNYTPIKYVECAASGQVMAEVADLNADVRDAASDYRDPAIATPQDKVADKLSGSSTPDLSSAGDSLSDAADAAKSKASSIFGSGSSSALPTPNLSEVADLNADVRDAASDYRDPAIATPQDKVADKLSGSSTPDLGSVGGSLSDAAESAKAKASSAARDAKAKSSSVFGSGRSSALPTPNLAEVADLNADVRDAASDYRDPAIATPQDKVADKLSGSSTPDLSSAGDSQSDAADAAKSKASSIFGSGSSSALPTPSLGEVADLNADVRDAASDYRDPAIAAPQDKVADKLSGSSTPDIGSVGGSLSDAAESAKAKASSAARDAKAKSSSVFGSSSSSALPTPNLGEVADLNADVRDAASDYRDPAIATPQDKVADKLSGSSTPDLSSAGDSLSDAADAAKSKASSIFGSGSSALPTPSLGEVADLNADVRDAASDYRDPAGAVQQDKFAEKVRGTSVPDLGDAADSAKAKAGAVKAKARRIFGNGTRSALPTRNLGEVADMNADVRDAASDYRDPAIATPQDKVADKLSGSSTPDIGSVGGSLSDAAESAKAKASSAARDAKAKSSSVFGSGSSSALPTPNLGEVADLNADVRDAASDYRDPAGAVQQDKFADKVRGMSVPDLGDAAETAKAKAGAVKAKGRRIFGNGTRSALPTSSIGEVADLNADVRDAASDYRDPAGAAQQDRAAGAAERVSPKAASAAGKAYDSLSSSSAKRALNKGKAYIKAKAPAAKDIGVKAGYGAPGTRVRDSAGILRNADDVAGSVPPPAGNARLSQPLVRDSLGVKRPNSVSRFGSAGGSDKGAKKAAEKVVDRLSG